MQRQQALQKFWRFTRIYGWQRAINKAIARTRPAWVRNPFIRRRAKAISLIGCGQFAFSCICFYLQKHRGNVFLNAFDTDPAQARSLSRYYGFENATPTPDDLLANPALRLLYVVSNHASHTRYAVAGLQRGLDVYVEKPVSVTYDQLVQLSVAQRTSTGRLFAGYNRPYSAAIQALRQQVLSQPTTGGFSLNYCINGHLIPADHWYRHPDEGSRVCGNLGHWLDLTIHIWSWRSLPTCINIQLAWANPDEPDDNLCITFTTDRHDITSIMLTARTEPFEGISESINLQYGDIIAHIDDFRAMTIWRGSQRLRRRYYPKDVGHERAILQPYHVNNRDWAEVQLSTLLMLQIKDMVLDRQAFFCFDVPCALTQLETAIQYLSTTPAPIGPS